MRVIFSSVLVLGFCALAAFAATAAPDYSSTCKTSWNAMAAADKAKTNYGDYLKTCRANGPSAAPPAPTKPVPDVQMSGAEKQQACESKWLAQNKITPTGSETHDHFIAKCVSGR